MADKKLKNLEDVDKELQKNTADGLQARRTKRQEAEARRLMQRELVQEYGRMAVIPVIVIVLMIIIVILDPTTRAGENPSAAGSETAAVSETDSAADGTDAETLQDDTETETTQDPTIVREYYDNTLEDFFAKYFAARLAADTDTIYRMTGTNADKFTDAQTSALKQQLRTQAGYIEGYQDIKLYAVNALEKYSKLVFVTYNVKFRRVDTPAPGIMYCYIRVNDKDSYEIVENMQPDQVKFVNDYVNNHTEVRELIDQADSKLLQAISSDQRLAVVYDAFMTGRIYNEDQSVIDSEVSLIETTAADEGAAPTGTAADTSESVQDGSAADESQTASDTADTQAADASETETAAETAAASDTAAQ